MLRAFTITAEWREIEAHAEEKTLSRRYPLQNMVDEMGKAGKENRRETMESLPVPLSLGNWPSLKERKPTKEKNTVKLIKKSRKMIQGEFCNVFLFQDPKFEKTTHEVIEITPDYYMVNIDGDGFGISTTLTPEERGFKDYQTAINKTNR